VFIEWTQIAERPEDIFVRRCTHAGYSCRPPVIHCDVCGSFVHLNRRYTVRILEARALLKMFFAVAHAAFISEINLASPGGRLRVAGKRLDTNGSAVISFSRLWNDFGCAEPDDIDEESLTAGPSNQQPVHRPAADAYHTA
jgi:hypothetical protein